MRDVADAAGLSLGAAYYYFPSKEALVFAFYADNQAEMEARVASYPKAEPLRERLGRLFHDKLHALAPNRRLLASIVPRAIDPHDPLSALSHTQAEIRARAIAGFDAVLAPEKMPDATRAVLARALWFVHLGVLLYAAHDDEPAQPRSHRLVDDLLDLVTPLVAAARTPAMAHAVAKLAHALDRAGLAIP
jgi:AcrR family transcriptional regulator